MDLNKLTTSDKVIAGSGILLFIAYFLDWFTVSFDAVSGFGGGEGGISGGDVGFLWATLPMLIGLVMAGVVIASKLFDVQLPDLPIPWGQALLGMGALAALLVILKLIIGYDVPTNFELSGGEISRSIGIFIAALAAIGLAVGGYLKYAGKEDDRPATGGNTGSAPF